MAITLRTITGSALTYEQLDTNFSSYFYSASYSSGVVTLFTTGSGDTGSAVPAPASMSFTIPVISQWTGSVSVSTTDSQIQITGSLINGSGSISAPNNRFSHGEGFGTTATGLYSHAEGVANQATETGSHAEGWTTTASGRYGHSEGISTVAFGTGSHAEGYGTIASGSYSHVEGWANIASGSYSHAEGGLSIALGDYSHAEGANGTSTGDYSHAEGKGTFSTGNYSHAEGDITTASGIAAHSEGSGTDAKGISSHAEGRLTRSSGSYSHAEGESTLAIGQSSHAEGSFVTASGNYSHAEGAQTIASGQFSHAEGSNTVASGQGSHAEGVNTVASGLWSHAQGFFTSASGNYQHVVGQYNITSSANSAFIIGNGTGVGGSRSNLVFASGSTVQVTGSLIVSGGVVDIGAGTYYPYDYKLKVDSGTDTFGIIALGSGTQFTGLGIGNTTSGRAELYLDASNGDFSGNDYAWIAQNNDLSLELTTGPASNGSIQLKPNDVTVLELFTNGTAAFSGSVTVGDILKLPRRTTTPGTPVEGMIIASGSAGASILYYYNGTSWNALF